MNRVEITISILKNVDKAFYEAVRDTAKSSDFKKIFEQLAFGGEYNLRNALDRLYNKDADLNNTIVKHVNDNSVYSSYMYTLIQNSLKFKNVSIPTRNCDFFVKNEEQAVYFYIAERIEITHNLLDNRLYLAKLMVDDKSDSLLYNDGESNWVEYGVKKLKTNDSSSLLEQNIALAYKSFLAEKQLLGDE